MLLQTAREIDMHKFLELCSLIIALFVVFIIFYGIYVIAEIKALQ